MSWDPTKQECRSYFGYGSGFFMAESFARAKAAKFAPDQSHTFCNECPIAQECWVALQDRVRVERPEAAAAWEALVAKNKADGVEPGRIAMALLKAGRPDPWMKSFLDNQQIGLDAAEGMAA